MNQRFMETYRRGDARGMREPYTEDAQLLPPNSDFVRGRQSIGDYWRGAMDLGIRSVELHTGEVEQHGDRVTEVNTATLLGAGDQVIDEVKYIVIWKREGGEWKIHRDIFNSSRPAA